MSEVVSCHKEPKYKFKWECKHVSKVYTFVSQKNFYNLTDVWWHNPLDERRADREIRRRYGQLGEQNDHRLLELATERGMGCVMVSTHLLEVF